MLAAGSDQPIAAVPEFIVSGRSMAGIDTKGPLDSLTGQSGTHPKCIGRNLQECSRIF
jgi:hypothetical protein